MNPELGRAVSETGPQIQDLCWFVPAMLGGLSALLVLINSLNKESDTPNIQERSLRDITVQEAIVLNKTDFCRNGPGLPVDGDRGTIQLKN